MVSEVAKAPGFLRVAAYVGTPLSDTLTTATPAPGGRGRLLCGATFTPADPNVRAVAGPRHVGVGVRRPSTLSGV